MKLKLPQFSRLRRKYLRRNRRRAPRSDAHKTANYRDGISTFMLPSLFEGPVIASASSPQLTSPNASQQFVRNPPRIDSPFPHTAPMTPQPPELEEDYAIDAAKKQLNEISGEIVGQEQLAALKEFDGNENAFSSVSVASHGDKQRPSSRVKPNAFSRSRFANASMESLITATTSSLSLGSQPESEQAASSRLERKRHSFPKRLHRRQQTKSVI